MWYKTFLKLVFSLSLPLIAGAQEVMLEGEGVSDGNYKAPATIDKIVVDGRGNEKSWQRAPWKTIHQVWLGDAPSSDDFQGRYKMVWDKEFLYFLVEIIDDSLSDQEPDPFVNWWEDDCLELFIDEDRSKGNHQFSHNAFAYHITLDYDVIDIGPDKKPHNYKDHMKVKRTGEGNRYIWEVAMRVFPDTYSDVRTDNRPVVLKVGKKMGFAVSYNDNDGNHVRENFIGSVYVEGEDKNQGWIDAGIFGEVELVK